MKKTAVVILNWNGRHLLEQFIPIVLKNTQHPNVDIIVADNASSDESINYIKQEHPEVHIIQLDKNYGFAGGYNKALSQIEADYFLLLNSDIAPEPNWITPLIEAMDSDDKLAACMPKVRDHKSPEYFEYAGASGGYIDIFGYPFCRGRILNQIEKDNGQYDEALPVFWATGAALLVKSDLYLKTGGLDESFFAHMEEIDLCWRIKNMGYSIKVIPSSVVLHVGGATLDQQHPKKTFLNFRNNLLMMLKNLSGWRLFVILFIRMILDGIAALHFLVKGEFRFFSAVFIAHLSFYQLIPDALKKRKRLSKFRIKHQHKEIYPRSIIAAFYLKKTKKFSELKHYNL